MKFDGLDSGERLKKLRIKRGLSQAELAKRIGVSRAAVSQWESGSNTPKGSHFSKLCYTLGTDLNWVFHGKKSKSSENIFGELSGDAVSLINKIIEMDKMNDKRLGAMLALVEY